MINKAIKVAVIAGLIGCFSSFSVVAETAGVESTRSAKVLAVKADGDSSQSTQRLDMAGGRQATKEPLFELLSLEGVLSVVLLILFFLVLIKGKVLRVD